MKSDDEPARPFEVYHAAYKAIVARGDDAWDRASAFAAGRLQMPYETVRLGALELCAWARVKTDGADPRRFAVTADGEPAMLVPWPIPWEPWDATDVVAISLDRARFWRWTLEAHSWWADERPRGSYVMQLREGARGWIRELMRFLAKASGGADPNPAPPPAGILVLAPEAIDWTRKGWLRGVEQVEILDAPVTGALARALKRRNPMLNGPRGARLVGTESRAAR